MKTFSLPWHVQAKLILHSISFGIKRFRSYKWDFTFTMQANIFHQLSLYENVAFHILAEFLSILFFLYNKQRPKTPWASTEGRGLSILICHTLWTPEMFEEAMEVIWGGLGGQLVQELLWGGGRLVQKKKRQKLRQQITLTCLLCHPNIMDV